MISSYDIPCGSLKFTITVIIYCSSKISSFLYFNCSFLEYTINTKTIDYFNN
uniref:Uncharacterized protein n=1 Tax=uncultured delta proteobacterium HF0200_19J16 TaxID=710831 RepID=E0XUD1_9DELT|nr:hypothetical protein [uncultured delta proteobacterium HF0200_19J16]